MNQTSSISIQSPSGSIDNFDDYENGGITDVVKMSIDFSTSLYPYSYEDACVTADVTVAELILSAGEDEDEGTINLSANVTASLSVVEDSLFGVEYDGRASVDEDEFLDTFNTTSSSDEDVEE
ncbi:MAG: hypothetical protein SNH71_04810 [Rikenellaceae bacterium]